MLANLIRVKFFVSARESRVCLTLLPYSHNGLFLVFLQRKHNEALAGYSNERQGLLARIDALSREIMSLRAHMVRRVCRKDERSGT